MLRFILIAFFAFTMVGSATSQKALRQVNALNNYVDFTNDCIHGLSIVHLMLHGFNNEVNSYVDNTGSYAFSNSDFGRDIYNDLSYYEHRQITPAQFFPKLKQESKVLRPKEAKALNATVTEMFNLAKSLNALRYETEPLISTVDLKDTSQVSKIYQKLETGVEMFDKYYGLRNKLNKQLHAIYLQYVPQKAKGSYYKAEAKLHSSFCNILHHLRAEKAEDIPSIMSSLKNNKEAFSALKPTDKATQEIVKNAEAGLKGTADFARGAKLPDNYDRYGKYYYYYNQVILFKLNTIGAGMAYKINEQLNIKNKLGLRFLELPAWFKVLYPKKLISTDVIKAQTNIIKALPTQLDERTLKVSKEIISVETEVLELKLYDHMLLDGDIVSVNFNGDWILKNKSLEKKPVRIKLNLNKTGKNFIILHAENEGIKPPNTMAVSYFLNGKKQELLMKSDMQTSEILEIQLDQ